MFRFLLFPAIFFFGAIIGSFLNCAIFRLEKKSNFVKGRSCCPCCHHKLAWYDLIPILSFVFLKRRCRYCQKPISWQYPLVELTTGILFVLIFCHLTFGIDLSFGFWHLDFLALIYYLLIACFLIIIFVYDLKHFIIPDKVVYSAIGISFLYRLLGICLSAEAFLPAEALAKAENLVFGILPSLFLLAIILLSRGQWMGLGDFKLAILMGLILGWPKILLALFFSFVIGGIIGTGLILFGKKKLKSEVPFAPFLIIGTIIALLWGEKIIHWYLSLLH